MSTMPSSEAAPTQLRPDSPAPKQGSYWSDFVGFFTSLKLTVVLLGFSIVLVFVATIDQVNLGVWAVQAKYFRSWLVFWRPQGSPIEFPVFPGGFLVGSFLFVNLTASHFYRFKLTWKKLGIHLTHIGLLLLLAGEALTAALAHESHLTLREGQTGNYLEDSFARELAIVETTPADHDHVVAIPVELLSKAKNAGSLIEHPDLPFRLRIVSYYPNADLGMRRDNQSAPPSPATQGIGTMVVAQSAPMTYKENEQNTPTAFVELLKPDGTSLGTWLVSLALGQPQPVGVDGRTFLLSMRSTRHYLPFSVTLKDFKHDVYPGTQIPKNFSSLVHLSDPSQGTDRDTLIYMNNPLRYQGLTFYQSGFQDNDTVSILQVVRNPSSLLPYIACGLMAFGLLFHFVLHLVGFMGRRLRAS